MSNERRDEAGPGDGREARRGRSTLSDAASAGERLDQHHSTAATSVNRRPPRRGRALRLLLLMLLLLAGACLAVLWALSPVSDESQLVELEVMPGWGASRVAQQLEDQGLVRNGRLFSAYLRLRGLDTQIGEGVYDLDRASSAPQLAEELVRGGRPRTAQVLLPEGIRGSELALRLEEAGLGSAERYRQLIEAPAGLRPGYVPPGATLEGYLFPASYEMPLSFEPGQVLEMLVERFERELSVEVREELGRLGLSVHDWVTIASIVQSEAGNEAEMPPIAGVFLNRLDLGMPLQSDPTVAYGLGKSLPELDPLAGDMRRDHPWNTYTRPGLPLGPISNPGRAALRAVLEPVRVDEQGDRNLYFLHGVAEGEPVLRLNTDLEGHNRDVERYLRSE